MLLGNSKTTATAVLSTAAAAAAEDGTGDKGPIGDEKARGHLETSKDEEGLGEAEALEEEEEEEAEDVDDDTAAKVDVLAEVAKAFAAAHGRAPAMKEVKETLRELAAAQMMTTAATTTGALPSPPPCAVAGTGDAGALLKKSNPTAAAGAVAGKAIVIPASPQFDWR